MKRLFIALIAIAVLCSPVFALNTVELGSKYYANPSSSRALFNADIFVGIPDLDPEVPANQKTLSVLQENGTVTAVAQPISTGAGGVPLFNGSPVTLLVEGDYSIKVLDSLGSQVYYVPNTTASAAGATFEDWVISTTYSQNAYIIGSDNKLYYSVAGANLGNDPTSTTGFWQGYLEDTGTATTDIIGDVKATNGTVVLDNGTDGTDATFTGDVTGDLTGNVTGDVTGNADTATRVPFRGALVHNSAKQVIGSGAGSVVLNFNEETYDTDNIHDISTNNERLTVPAGVSHIRIFAQISGEINANTGRLQVTFGGSPSALLAGITGVKDHSTVVESTFNLISPVVAVSPGDYVTVSVAQTTGVNLNVSQSTNIHFAMEIID